jgi:signal transduction histidine kinase
MEVIALHKSTAQQSGSTLTCTIDDRVPSLLNTDVTAFKRILHNLIDNGLKFTKAGAVQVDVSRNGELVRFAVTDSGIGISPKNQKKLFVNYAQVHEFETREVTGTGLGLALTRSLVQLLGGNIEVQSSVGKGSTFWFNLPLGIRRAGQQGVGS